MTDISIKENMMITQSQNSKTIVNNAADAISEELSKKEQKFTKH